MSDAIIVSCQISPAPLYECRQRQAAVDLDPQTKPGHLRTSSLVSCYHLNSLSQFVINTWPEIYHWLCCNSWNATCYLYISLLKWHLQPVYLWPFFCFWNSVSNNLLLVKLWYCRTPLDLWKHAYISRFPQKVSWCFVIQNNKYLYY